MSARFAAVVLAGDRAGGDPVARAANAPCKALSSVAGRPMVLRVLDALRASEDVGSVLLVGPEREHIDECAELRDLIDGGEFGWIGTAATPAASAFRALNALEEAAPVLVTTADHALLTPEIVGHFCARARTSGHDAVAAVAAHADVARAFPDVRRTVLRLRGGAVCGCNLFAFLTPEGRRLAHFWQRVEAERKRPLRVARVLGWGAVVRYALGRLTLDQALLHLSRQTALSLGVVRMPFPEAAVDVDTAEDLAFARARLEGAGAGEA